MKEQTNSHDDLLDLTTQIVVAHVAHNKVSVGDVPSLIDQVHTALSNAGKSNGAAAATKPAVPVSKSITKDYQICLEDGTEHKMLKRYLMRTIGMTPEQYRKKWGLAGDYPMVAPSYSRRRSALAKKFGLGTKRMRTRTRRAKG